MRDKQRMSKLPPPRWHYGPNRHDRRKRMSLARKLQRKYDRKMQHASGIRVMRYGVGNRRGGI